MALSSLRTADAGEPFAAVNGRYEEWLRKQCEVDEPDLAIKHEKMRESPFVFLRATYFRWAGTARSAPRCPRVPRWSGSRRAPRARRIPTSASTIDS